MQNSNRKAFSILPALLALMLPAMGQAFELRPMTQTFEPAGGGANRTFTVTNEREDEVAVSVAVKERAVDAAGKEKLTDTGDFVVFPTQILLKGKSSQVIRVQWQGERALSSERSYRIIAEQVPLKSSPALSEGPSMSIKLIVRFGGTIYVAPVEAKSDVVVASANVVRTPKGSQLDLVLENRGNRHAIIESPSLSIMDGKKSNRVLEAEMDKALAGENILAGGRRSLSLPWPSEQPVGPVAVKFDATFLQ